MSHIFIGYGIFIRFLQQMSETLEIPPHPKVAMASLSVPARHTRCPHSYSPVFLPDVTDVPHSSAGRQQGTATQTIVQGKVIYS